MAVRITTNNVPRPVIDAYELSPDERAEFDYLDWDAIEKGEDSASFFRYKGRLYDLGEFMIVRETQMAREDDTLRGWDGYSADSFFSGLLVRYPREDHYGESVVVGWYCS